jgi:hypothetical protein
MGMTDEELHAAQPPHDFKFNMYDESTRVEHRDVVVPNWIARDGRWAEIYNAVKAAECGQIAKATEQIVKALERAREYGRMEAESGREPEGKLHVERWENSNVNGPISSREKSQQDLAIRTHRGLRRPFDPAFPGSGCLE